MSALEQHLAEYLAVRRAMGYKLERAGLLLAQFTGWLADRDVTVITTELALAWATLPTPSASNWHGQRLSAVRGFAAHLHAIDPGHEVPAADLLAWRRRRQIPYLYDEQQITALMTAAGTLGSAHRTATISTLIGLLSVTGMRVGEAIRLDRADLDAKHQLLTVHDTKFGKSRELALHPSTITALGAYLRRRDRPAPAAQTSAVFVSAAGTRLIYCNVQHTFSRLVDRAGLPVGSTSCRPRLHDLRHSFAVATLIDAYRSGEDVQARLALLSTYLGHVSPGSTYWYLQAAPELMALAAERLEDHLGGAGA